MPAGSTAYEPHLRGRLLAQHLADARDGAAGADPATNASRWRPSSCVRISGRRGAPVDLGVGEVPELLRHEVVGATPGTSSSRLRARALHVSSPRVSISSAP